MRTKKKFYIIKKFYYS